MVLFACSSSKESKKTEKITSYEVLLSMDEGQVRKTLGEPTTISKTGENHILWTYKPSWRIIPYNRDTIYIEFDESGKVIRVHKVK